MSVTEMPLSYYIVCGFIVWGCIRTVGILVEIRDHLKKLAGRGQSGD